MLPAEAISVDRSRRGEAVRKLKSSGLVDSRFEFVSQGGRVIVPLRQSAGELAAALGAEGADVSVFSGRYAVSPPEALRLEARVDDSTRELLPRKWEMLGRAAIVKLDRRTEGESVEIGRALATVLHAESVYAVRGRMQGKYRKPQLDLVYGPGGETVHHENGVDFVMDPAKVMFSSANHDERIRMSTIDCTGETVVDMFAGIGHLSMPIAVHSNPERIVAAEADAETYGYLLKTVAANGAGGIYRAVNADNAELEVSGADRILMGYLDQTRRSLGKALSMSRRGTVIHFHEEVGAGLEREWRETILESSCGGRARVLGVRKVKSLSARTNHLAMDLEVLG